MNHRKDFPIFKNQPELIYLDSAATSHKPETVLNAITDFYTKSNANVHRGIYELSETATQMYEDARASVARFLSVSQDEVVFTSGTTESANIIAYSLLNRTVNAEDVLISSVAEHHSNFLPLQNLAKVKAAELKLVRLTPEQDFDYAHLEELLNKYRERVKALALSAVSNVLGFKLDISRVTQLVKQYSPQAITIIDAAQIVGHHEFKPDELNIDFAFFSGHKLLAETGIGVLWGRKELLEQMPPFQVGGGMIASVSTDKTTYAPVPSRFEAGTPHISGAISVAAAIKYLENIGITEIDQYLHSLTQELLINLQTIPELTVYGPQHSDRRSSLVSFSLKNIHPHDVAQYLNDKNIAVRAGHHCTQILHKDVFDISGSVRMSLHIYNVAEDIRITIKALKECINYYADLKHER